MKILDLLCFCGHTHTSGIAGAAVETGFLHQFKCYRPSFCRVQRVVAAALDIFTGKIPDAALAYDNFARMHELTLLALDSQPLSGRIAS